MYVNYTGNFGMLYMPILRNDHSSAALNPKYWEDKIRNIEIREALNLKTLEKNSLKHKVLHVDTFISMLLFDFVYSY